MCELILKTISNTEFIKLLYGDDSIENIEERRNILLDLYLNTRGKGWNETPLHYAVRECALECVEVLTSYPQCDRNCTNKYGETPTMVSWYLQGVNIFPIRYLQLVIWKIQ